VKVLAIIPARGGSKGVPRKNVKKLNGIPLVAYGICSSLNAETVDRVVVSTDDDEIAEVSKKYGAEVIMRPSEYSQDLSPSEEGMRHVVENLESEGWKPDLIVLVQCTSPFRLSKHIDEAVNMLIDGGFTGVASVSENPGHFHPYKIKEVKEDGELVSMVQEEGMKNNIIESHKYKVRQDLPGTYYWMNGAVYVSTYDTLMKDGDRYGKRCGAQILNGDTLANIDSEADFEFAQWLIDGGEIQLDFDLVEINS
jgi:N-acylneuraminate cytidylyltransferase/CMP-N,N'-diacetyllegionaminic acid synthase|tara:strand:+ start:4541 stop:5299 length:759 start_codon:yes stop_codon:yes gene_type:complete